MLKKLLAIIAIFTFEPIDTNAQTLPKFGSDTILDIGNWNIEWFGDSQNGPTDETTQFNNVKKVLEQTDIDVWGLAEMSNNASYSSLLTQLGSIYEGANSSFSATQKMCLFYKKSMFKIIPSLSYNIPANSTAIYNYASRAPLQVALETVGGNITDTIYFLVVHLKAYADVDSYNRRVGASQHLKGYIESYLAGKKFIIIGDWNDKLLSSTYNNSVTPFKNLLDAGYTFSTKPLEEANKTSYTFSTSFLDHQMQSKTLDSFYMANSAKVFDNIGSYINNYSNNTSDHYPVYSAYNWKKLTYKAPIDTSNNDTSTTSLNLVQKNSIQFKVYPNPNTGLLQVTGSEKINTIEIINQLGQMVFSCIEPKNIVDIQNLPHGIYYLKATFTNQFAIEKLVKQ